MSRQHQPSIDNYSGRTSESVVQGRGLAKLFVIDIPRKVSLKRVQSWFEPEAEYEDVDDGVFIFKQCGNAIFRSAPWKPGVKDDFIYFNSLTDAPLLEKLKLCTSALAPVQVMIRKLVTMYWDCFAEMGIKRPILGFEFSIDTGKRMPVCCKKSRYGSHESRIILKQVKVLLAEGLIERCATGGWRSPIVLAPKPYQEHVNMVEDLIWRFCVSHRGLNRITNPFEYPIVRCDDTIEDVGDGTQYVYFMSVDSVQGYHQIKVRRCDKEKLAFLSPDDEKYTWSLMPFGPTNAPSFFTVKHECYNGR